ncbi:MAG TPA: MerR family transcriptional regulator [Chitinophagaceae bacterium]|nr:MerR family transcriptional regulator [Chitinophagaceae bacterium]HMZ46275.1 MerR family transcriptional regulator [Chitinophagaceae bacterium]HNE94195.1 MerR family transcriptional regulator [Chitinophagaceae bacterium]HNJ57903.1 MerR family transcriptional regulator [Chitinophagaceae bacterium]HNL82933.1 MerR family transcriptional regulator [Chitinophagaceae bacterium]
MAKNKTLKQLDLFAAFEPTPATVNEIEANLISAKQVVFANDKIGVKLKSKNTTVTSDNSIIKKQTSPEIQIEKNLTTKNKRGRKSFKEMDAEIDLVNVPSDEILKKKLYYPIREVAAFFNVNASLIRVWETEFDILQPRKNRKGDRLFRVEDIKNIQVIYYLLRNRKFSLDGAKKYLKENKGKLTTNQQLIQSLIQLKSFLTEIKTSLLVKNN